MSVCPKCQRSFEEATSFCPYDGTQTVDLLVPGAPPPVRPQVVIDSRPAKSKPEHDGLIGQTLDNRYRIESRVGEGGMGVVFRARHVVIEKPVAVKVLKREVARDQQVVRRFVQEARAASRIGHPNIVDVTDFGVTPEGMTYQVMEYLEGQTLSAVLRREKHLPVARTLPIVAQLARALGAAHDKGIVHRDLKPENVFLLARDGRQDFVKVVDFGIAKVAPAEGGPEVPRLTRVGAVFGTPEYMAPEQCQGRGDTDNRVDIYALGTLFYEMLVGTVPHRGETPMRTLALQLLAAVSPPREAMPELVLSDALEAVVMRALAKPRQERFRSMLEMLDALTAAATDVSLDQPLSVASQPLIIEFDGVRSRPITSDDAETLPMRVRSRNPVDSAAGRGSEPAWSGVTARAAMAEIAPPLEHRRPARRGWAIAGVLLALSAGIGITAALLSSRGDRAPARPTVAMPAPVARTDAAPPAEPTEPAADPAIEPAPPEPAAIIDQAAPRRPRRMRPAEPVIEVEGKGPDIEIQVVTEPRGGRLIHGDIDGGPDGTNFRRPEGTVLNLECRKYDRAQRIAARGTVRIAFDGTSHLAICRMTPVSPTKCVEGLKNPLDDCPE